MTDRERYEKLDDIGFVGVQNNRTQAQIKRDALKTSRHIEAQKAKIKKQESKNKKSTSATAK